MSQTKREQQSVQTVVPSPDWTVATDIPALQDNIFPAPTTEQHGMPLASLNTGPPGTRPPLYKRYLALLF